MDLDSWYRIVCHIGKERFIVKNICPRGSARMKFFPYITNIPCDNCKLEKMDFSPSSGV